MHALAEEYARRTMELGHDDAFSTVDDERTPFGHIGNRPEVHVLNDDAEIFVFVVRAIELQLGFQRNAVGQSALEALLDRIARRVDIVVDELQNEVIPGIRDGEIFLKDLVESLVLTVFGRSVHLEKIPEGFELHLQQIRIGNPVLDCREADSLLCFCCGHREIQN